MTAIKSSFDQVARCGRDGVTSKANYLSLREGKSGPSACMEAAMNESSHGEEQSDAAIQLEFQMDCHARRAGLAMTKPVSSLGGAKRRSNPADVSDGLPR